MLKHKIVVIGGGPAGMAAAVAAWDNGEKDVVIIDREAELGGILCQCIHNGFGLHKLGRELTGPEYAYVYYQKIVQRNIKVYCETTVNDIQSKLNKKIITAQNKNGIMNINADAVILAMGCRERSRGALNICGERPAGVFSAGCAQKLMNCYGYKIGRRVVILGSGDIGLIMARRLTLQGSTVEAVCEIMPYSSGLKRNIVQCLDDFGISLYLNTTVVKVHGKNRVEGVTISQVDENKNPIVDTYRFIPCDALLTSVGLIPENELAIRLGIRIDPITGGAVVDQYRQTEVKGIFACGNVLQVHDLVDYVSDEAEIAGASAAKYCKGLLKSGMNYQVVPQDHIRYVVPQRLSQYDAEVDLYFRVSNPISKAQITVRMGEQILIKKKKQYLAPGEMEKLTLNAEQMKNIDNNISVLLEVL